MVKSTTFASSIGLSGTLKIIAPVPTSEIVESPLRLVAVTLTSTESPHCKNHGAPLMTERGIWHVNSSINYEPSQFTKSYEYVTPSDSLTTIE